MIRWIILLAIGFAIGLFMALDSHYNILHIKERKPQMCCRMCNRAGAIVIEYDYGGICKDCLDELLALQNLR